MPLKLLRAPHIAEATPWRHRLLLLRKPKKKLLLMAKKISPPPHRNWQRWTRGCQGKVKPGTAFQEQLSYWWDCIPGATQLLDWSSTRPPLWLFPPQDPQCSEEGSAPMIPDPGRQQPEGSSHACGGHPWLLTALLWRGLTLETAKWKHTRDPEISKRNED